MSETRMQRRYRRFPRLMFLIRRLGRVNYEREMELLDVLCDKQRTSVDIGAKLGMYTYRLLRHSRDVVAFEPIPLLNGMLQKVFARKPVKVVPCALSNAPGRTQIRVPYGSNGEVKFGRSTIERSNALAHDDVAKVETFDVALETLDQQDLRGLGFIKIDVEGHELAVLEGASATLEREKPTLLVESNDHHHPDAVAKLRTFMSAHGYRGWFIEGARLLEVSSIPDTSYFKERGLENFIFIHESRDDVRERLAARFRS